MRHWQNQLQRKAFYGSHMPVIARLMELTTGPVLEMGMGIYSTALLDLMCHETKRPLVSYDNDPTWFNENKIWGQSDYHKVFFVDDYDKADIENTHWSVVLIDHRPPLRRYVDIKRLTYHADYILIHDSEPESDKYLKYSIIYPLFKFRYDYKLTRPNTTILSNFFDPEIFFNNMGMGIIGKIPSYESLIHGKNLLEAGCPWLTPGAIIEIEKIVSKDMRVLEFGSGGSTIFWANNCKSVKSYDTSLTWNTKVNTISQDYKNITAVCGNDEQILTMTTKEPDNYYDLILIDILPKNNRRLILANASIPKLKKGGYLIIDNYSRFGMENFDYSKWKVFTYDSIYWSGGGTRICQRIT